MARFVQKPKKALACVIRMGRMRASQAVGREPAVEFKVGKASRLVAKRKKTEFGIKGLQKKKMSV